MRLLWKKMMQGFSNDNAKDISIHTSTSLRNKTSLDIYNNLLRTTVESMSAVIGGTDLHNTKLHDEGFLDYSRASMRYALNVQHILRHESHLDKVADLAGGSYYIEDLTTKLCDAAWSVFLDIEKQGGYLKAVETAYLQKMIKKSAESYATNVNTVKKTLIGLNKYARVDQTSCSAKPIFKEFIAKEPEIEILEKLQVVSDFEKQRSLLQIAKKKAAIISFGDKKISNSRSEFCQDVMSSIGVESFKIDFYTNIEDFNQNMEVMDADFWIFCASDADYSSLIDLLKLKKNPTPAFIAGKLENEELKKLIKGNLYLGMDLLALMVAINSLN